jgi:hypothetical protein
MDINDYEMVHMYKTYSEFYKTTENSLAFSQYCERVFGADFTHDGFSDLNQYFIRFWTARDVCYHLISGSNMDG